MSGSEEVVVTADRLLDPAAAECRVSLFSSRVCALGTKGCTADHPVSAAVSPAEPSAATAFRVEAVALVDEWLDGQVAEAYRKQPLAQDWARVAKVIEEAGEAIAALIAWTGQNPRKPQRPEARDELLSELADVALTAIFGMQHFTKDAGQTWAYIDHRLSLLRQRAEEATRGR